MSSSKPKAPKTATQKLKITIILDAAAVDSEVVKVKTIVEKPGPERAPSHLASLGGFIFTPDIFSALQKTKIGKGGELWLVDAIFRLLKERPVYARKIEGIYYDTGSKLGYLKANVDFAQRLAAPIKKTIFRNTEKDVTFSLRLPSTVKPGVYETHVIVLFTKP